MRELHILRYIAAAHINSSNRTSQQELRRTSILAALRGVVNALCISSSTYQWLWLFPAELHYIVSLQSPWRFFAGTLDDDNYYDSSGKRFVDSSGVRHGLHSMLLTDRSYGGLTKFEAYKLVGGPPYQACGARLLHYV